MIQALTASAFFDSTVRQDKGDNLQYTHHLHSENKGETQPDLDHPSLIFAMRVFMFRT